LGSVVEHGNGGQLSAVSNQRDHSVFFPRHPNGVK
jgi:hypothetical protein